MSEYGQGPWATEIAEELRALPNRWDDRRGPEFDCLASDDRGAIERKRNGCLSTAGKLVIRAILDHRWLSGPRFVELEDWANLARETEKTKPYRQGAVRFLGMFVAWCREHADQLPPGTPAFGRLDCHTTSFRSEDVSRKDFAQICEATAWLLSATAPQLPQSAQARTDAEEVRHWTPPAGYVGRKTICTHHRFRKNGKNPAATTIDGWLKSAKHEGQSIDIKRDPANGENYYPEAWILKRIRTWNPRTSAT